MIFSSSNKNNNTSPYSRSLMTLYCFFLSLNLFGVVCCQLIAKKMGKKWGKKSKSCLCIKTERQNCARKKQFSSSQKKNSHHLKSSSWRRVPPPRTTPRSRRYSSRYITKIEVNRILPYYSARTLSFFLSFFLSLDRGGPQKSSTHLF